MATLSTIQALKKIAAEKFKLGDLRFVEFDTIKSTELGKVILEKVDGVNVEGKEIHQVDAWADMGLSYEGTPPESYRVLNTMIMDWVDGNEEKIKKEINPKLKDFLAKAYPDIDTSDLNEDFDDYIWEDQVDYMPEIDEENNEIRFTIELVLDVEEMEQDKEGD